MGDTKQKSQPSPVHHPLFQVIDPPGPLHDVAWWIGHLGSRFWWLWYDIKGIWLIGPHLAWPFYQAYERCYWAAHYLSKADERIESLNWDSFIDNFERWAMKFLGANAIDFWYFGNNLFKFSLHRIGLPHDRADWAGEDFQGWLNWRMRAWWGFLDGLQADPAGWIKEKIVATFPKLAYLFDDPESWVLFMLGVPWFERIIWKNHLFAYLLYRWGLSRIDALVFESSPAFFIRWKVEQRWPFLDNLLLDPVGWLWPKWKDSIDRYLDAHIDWLVRTAGRVLSLIWQAKI